MKVRSKRTLRVWWIWRHSMGPWTWIIHMMGPHYRWRTLMRWRGKHMLIRRIVRMSAWSTHHSGTAWTWSVSRGYAWRPVLSSQRASYWATSWARGLWLQTLGLSFKLMIQTKKLHPIRLVLNRKLSIHPANL